MRLLVVEDNDKVGKFIVKGLREEGYAVDAAVRGDAVLGLVGLDNYDLIVLDIMLPGLNGFEITRRLRAKGFSSPILMLTAKSRLEDKVTGLDLGADDFLTKPFAFAELLARIRALLRRRTGTREPVLRAADLAVDPVDRSVRRAGQTIELTPREYALLDFLLRNKGRVLTRTSIIEHVWDMAFDSDTNLVDVYIRHLRAKLDDNFNPKLIHTIRGVGYALRDG